MKTTPYEDINKVIDFLSKGLLSIFGKNLIGFYLTGSLTYKDFNPDRSDIDLLAVLKKPVFEEQLELIKKLHEQIGLSNKKWAKRIECSYIPIDMLQETLPPKLPRPYFGQGILQSKTLYGNEWLINNYLLYKHGIALIGPDFKKLVKPIDIKDVQKACIRDLFTEWKPKIKDPTYFNNSLHQSYVVLNLCRILYTVVCSEIASKKASSEWVKNKFTPEWKNLIQTAQDWKYGTEMNLQKETIEFIKFVITKIISVREKYTL